MKIDYRRLVKTYLIFAVSLFISAVCYNVFISPVNLVVGGNNGISIVVRDIFDISPSVTIFVLCFVFMIVAFIFLGKEDAFAALFITIVYPFFISITSCLSNYLVIDTDSVLLVSVFAGIIGGFTNGMIYRNGLNTGGIGILSKVLYKKYKVSISKMNFVINFIIVMLGGYLFGFNMILYAAIYLYISSVVCDKVLLGISRNKVFYIISDDYKNIVCFLREKLGHDVTIYDIIGKYSLKKMKMIMAVVPSNEYFVLKEVLSNFDSKPFVFVSDGYEVKGQDLMVQGVKQ